MEFFVCAALVVLGLIMVVTIVLGLPGNWIVLGLIAVYHFGVDQSGLTLWFWGPALAAALLGEVLEFILQIRQAKKYGSSKIGTLGGMIGAIIGAILCAPFFLGVGALLGALAGAWCGCFLFECCKGTPSADAAKAAFGAMMGRFLGTVCKLGCGVFILLLLGRCLFKVLHLFPLEGAVCC